jgi:NAD(P)H-dependent flavin oxidoreductase YrpB (nitropropane dioxygenase family)
LIYPKKLNLTEHHLKRIQDKLQQVLKTYASLQKENNQLKKELDKAKQQALQHQKKNEGLRQQVEVLKLSKGEMKAADKKEFEKRINSHLKEIDRCIALLSQ